MIRTIQTQGRKYEYDETKELGRGAFGEVYKGVALATGEVVAIKVLRKQNLDKYGEAIMQAIGNEVNILQQISLEQNKEPCPFIVKIYDCFASQNYIFIVLEFCNEGNVQHILNRQKKIPEEDAAYILYQIICALDYLSRRGIAHRDLKPENIFIKDGVYKLGDFGFASQKRLFQTALGTPPYQ